MSQKRLDNLGPVVPTALPAEPCAPGDQAPEARAASVAPDHFRASQQTNAARALVQSKSIDFGVSMGLSDTIDAVTSFARSALLGAVVDAGSVERLSGALDRSRSGFEVRLAHMLCERVLACVLIGARERQRLSTAFTQAFGRTGEKFDASRPGQFDHLGMARGESPLVDKLIQAPRASSRAAFSASDLQEMVQTIISSKQVATLAANYEGFTRALSAGLITKSDSVALLRAFWQTQARLRATVIALVPGGMRGQMIAPTHLTRAMTAFEKQALATHLKAMNADALSNGKRMLQAILKPPLFAALDANAFATIK